MKLNFLLPLATVVLFTACNNSSDKKDNKGDSAKNSMNMDTSHHMPAPGAEIPALPAIPAGAKVLFSNLKDGAVISSPYKIVMGTEVIKVDTAGPVVTGSGHHQIGRAHV